MESVRVRFAPSPTGMFHIGSARTALFNWLYARHTGGTFILRIEDTDAARNKPEYVDVIFHALSWLGLDWDEGPMPKPGDFSKEQASHFFPDPRKSGYGPNPYYMMGFDASTAVQRGDKGPYFQSQRAGIYKSYVDKLRSEGKAYESDGAIKFRMPKTPCTVPDLIRGNTIFDRTNEPDLVIQRKDGTPVFHLVNVVDDIEMAITHVIRGEDHLSNTQKHLALIEAFGAKPPLYAHIPLILNPNGSKMSKRDVGSSIAEYQEQGYLPEAVRNYLCLLGWSSRDNREVLPIKEVVDLFDLPQISHSNAHFDLNKLFWINGEYMRTKAIEELHEFARNILLTSKSNEIDQETLHQLASDTYEKEFFREALKIVREKIKLGRELPEWMGYFFREDFYIDPVAAKKVFTPEGLANIGKLRERLSQLDAAHFTAAELETEFKTLAAATSQKVGALIHPTRLAVSGRPVGPSLYHLLEVLGKDRVLGRMESAGKKFAS